MIMPSMKDLIAGFPAHLKEGVGLADNAPWKNPGKRFKAVLITGLGGSGIGGSLAAEWMNPTSATPILVNKDYYLPAWVDEHALVIACSYSGNTEETLSAMDQALERNAEVAVISSGGSMLQIAKEKGLNAVELPGGNPPRSMMGYSISCLMAYLEFYGLNVPDWRPAWDEAVRDMDEQKERYHKEAEEHARTLHGKTIAVYATDGLAAMGERMRQQFNENSKMLGWSAAIPEMNHNELVGWAGGDQRMAVLVLRHSGEFERNAVRAEINKETLKRYTPHLLEWRSDCSHPIAQALCLSHLADWTSYYLSEMNGVDIMDIQVIDHLKSELGKL